MQDSGKKFKCKSIVNGENLGEIEMWNGIYVWISQIYRWKYSKVDKYYYIIERISFRGGFVKQRIFF